MAETTASSVAKALALLEAMARTEGGVAGVSDLAAIADMPKSTAHRLLSVLEQRGFIGRIGSKYRVGSRLFELSQAARFSEYSELRDLAVPHLEWLFEKTGATVHLAVIDSDDVLYLEKITGAGGCRIPSRVGGRMPATCTALGKAMLAFSAPQVVKNYLRAPMPRVTAYSVAVPALLMQQLTEIRSTGVAYDYEEARLGVACVAAPVLRHMRSVAALSIGTVNCVPLTQHSGTVREAAARISRDLQGCE